MLDGQELSSLLALVLQELNCDIRDITQVHTWDPGRACTWMVTGQGVGLIDLLHPIFYEDWLLLSSYLLVILEVCVVIARVRYSIRQRTFPFMIAAHGRLS